jgi:small basic protein (TIGR04137 family)
MTMDRTLKVHGGLTRTRSVLTRAERIARLVEEEKFDPESDSPLGLPKVRVRHSKAGMKSKKDDKAAEVGVAEGAETTKPESAAGEG